MLLDLSAIIAQLRTYATYFNGVHGAGNLPVLERSEVVDLPVPTAHVVPLTDSADLGPMHNALTQNLTSRFGVVMMLDNSETNNRTGIEAAVVLKTATQSVFSAILNWTPDAQLYHPIRYGGGRLIDMDRGRLYWMLEFIIISTLCGEDGFNPDHPDFEDVHIKYDMISPHDGSGDSGPDGQIDAEDRVLNLEQ